MASSEKTNQAVIVTHSLLIGLTPLIPVPFVDDIAKSYFQQRLVRQLAEAQGQTLSAKTVSVLGKDRGGCLSGCLGTIFLYPIKKIFRKIFFILEWQRAINLVTHSYYHGYLLDIALREGWLLTDDINAAERARAAIDRSREKANTRLLRDVVVRTFRKSRGLIKEAARRLAAGVKGKKAADENVEKVLEQEEPQTEVLMQGVASELQEGIAGLPAGHFEGLAERLRAEYSKSTGLPG
jgi:hypothetical protein